MQTNLRQPQQLFAQPIRYEVPDFQRRYVWKQDEQWEPLWDDVADLAQSLMEDGSEAHFLGAVVLQPAGFPTGGPERRIVVDGQQRLTTLQLLIDAVQEVLADQELRERFVKAPLYRILTQRRLRMVLTGIEERLRTPKAESPEAPRDLHIEHIMPQAWYGDHWALPAGADRDEATANRKRAVHTIGNLTLVNKRLNSSLSNGPWNEKREALADHSVMFLSKPLVHGGPEIWDEHAIEARAKWLHEHAVKVWPHADGFDPGSG